MKLPKDLIKKKEKKLKARKSTESEIKVKRPHTCPVVYLQNYARLTPKYIKRLENFTTRTYREPTRQDYLIYAHDKNNNGPIFQTTLVNIGVRTRFYKSNDVENYLKRIESRVAKEFRTIRGVTSFAYVDPYPIFRFMMSQLVRTPKFLKKIDKDLNYLKSMSEEEFNESLMRLYLVQKPKEVTDKVLHKIHQDMILHNTLERIYKWSKMTLITNHTSIPYITSESPVIYHNIEFLSSYLNNEKRIEFSLIFNSDALFYFPIDPQFAVIVNDFDNNRDDAFIDYDEVFEEEKVMLLNMLMYQYSDKLILLKEDNKPLLNNIRKKCGSEINRDYQSLKSSYDSIKQYIEDTKQE